MRAMERPFVLAQLSDPHIGATWAGGDPVAAFAGAVECVRALEPQPDAVLVSGDLADNATDFEYEQVRELLAPLRAPLFVLAGNHDSRAALRRHFGIDGTADHTLQYSVDLGPMRLVVLDTTRPGEDVGSLSPDELEWLDRELTDAPQAPTLVAMHHPPLATGVPAWDEQSLPVPDRQALGDVIARHPQVQRVVAGHLHRSITGDLAGRPVMTASSTYVQARLRFGATELELADEPAGFVLHAVVGGRLVSHVQPVR